MIVNNGPIWNNEPSIYVQYLCASQARQLKAGRRFKVPKASGQLIDFCKENLAARQCYLHYIL